MIGDLIFSTLVGKEEITYFFNIMDKLINFMSLLTKLNFDKMSNMINFGVQL